MTKYTISVQIKSWGFSIKDIEAESLEQAIALVVDPIKAKWGADAILQAYGCTAEEYIARIQARRAQQAEDEESEE